MDGINVISGYAAVNLSCELGDRTKDRWIGIVQGNVYCDKTHKQSNRAVKDAKKLYEKLFK